ncbi:E3 ubiquitin-protein ligase AIP2-like protein [Drosera capensis]
MMAAEDDSLRKQLEELKKQLGTKQTFEGAVASIKSLLIENYASSSASTRDLFFSVVCRVATVLRTRYTAQGYLIAGLRLLEEAERVVTDAAERKHIRGLIEGLRKELSQDEGMGERDDGQGGGRGGYLFEGHLTVDPEPPQPAWLVHQNLVASLAASAESSQQGSNGGAAATPENLGTLLQGLIESMEDAIPEFLDDNGATTGRKAPPASKAAVAKLPVIKVDQDVLFKVGEDAECAICKEKLVVGDEMQELPCKHTFHPPCLKPWLDEHNSCPICRHELPTDDHAYESWKEREKELEEERRGAGNALHGGEFMYV